MIIRLKHLDIGILCLHMAMMRQNVRKGFKSNYGKAEGKERLALFDEVKGALEFELNQQFNNIEEDPNKIKQFFFDGNELMMISSFLDFYIDKLEDTLQQAGKINEEDQGQLDSLRLTKSQLDHLKVLHKVG